MKELKILMLINILCVSAMMAFLSVVGPIIRVLNMQEWHAGVMVSVAGVVWVLISRYWGRKSDVVGRKKILLMGVAGVGISYLLMAIYVNIAIIKPPMVLISLVALVVARTLIGAFYAAITPASNALIADHVQEDKRTSYIAKLGAANGLGMILGPTIGGFLAVYGLAIPLYVFAILPFLGVLALQFSLKDEKPVAKEKDEPLKVFDPRIRLAMIASFLTMMIVVSSQVCMGFYVLDTLHVNLKEGAKFTGYLLSAVGIVFIIAQIFVSKISILPKTLLLYGSLIGALGYGIFSLFTTQLFLLLGVSIGAFGLGLLFPAFNTLAVNSVEKNEQGASAGTVSAAGGLGIVVAPILSTALYSFAPNLTFWALVAIFLGIFVATLILAKTTIIQKSSHNKEVL